jgi:hypothetical protein
MSTPMGKAVFTIFGAVAELERMAATLHEEKAAPRRKFT